MTDEGVELVTDLPGLCPLELHYHRFRGLRSTPHLVTCKCYPTEFTWISMGFKLRKWIDHLMDIFSGQSVSVVFAGKHRHFKMTDLKRALNGLEIQSLELKKSGWCPLEALKVFKDIRTHRFFDSPNMEDREVKYDDLTSEQLDIILIQWGFKYVPVEEEEDDICSIM